ncbi:hypothetical protein PR048_027180 [Dryococelus australis]|uniref:Uncharacterized protein n=1 Tax=Dryococelus australis TaxID=614101 RepID=A0ABQ9GER1_9NEOP|nr:hypothetical protein PR048_027180 [Dryococelus australis]
MQGRAVTLAGKLTQPALLGGERYNKGILLVPKGTGLLRICLELPPLGWRTDTNWDGPPWDGPARPRSRSEGAIRATLTRTPGASSLLRAWRAILAALIIEGLRADEGDARRVWSSAETQGWRKREIPERTPRPAASSGTILTCENPGATPTEEG